MTQIHPALERVLGPRMDHPAVPDLIETWPTPAALTTAGKTRVRTRLLKKAPRLGGRLTEEIFAARWRIQHNQRELKPVVGLDHFEGPS